MSEKRKKNKNWIVTDDDGRVTEWDQVIVAILMDLRDELQKLNNLLGCSNFIQIPHTLAAIKRNTTKKRKKRAKAA